MMLTFQVRLIFNRNMFLSAPRHTPHRGRLFLRLLALLQIVVMLTAVLPAFGSEPSTRVNKEVSATAQDHLKHQEQGKDSCPCCPDDGQSGDDDACSSCGQCAVFTTLTSINIIKYLPAVSSIETFERRTKLSQVHIPIFVPPQNLA